MLSPRFPRPLRPPPPPPPHPPPPESVFIPSCFTRPTKLFLFRWKADVHIGLSITIFSTLWTNSAFEKLIFLPHTHTHTHTHLSLSVTLSCVYFISTCTVCKKYGVRKGRRRRKKMLSCERCLCTEWTPRSACIVYALQIKLRTTFAVIRFHVLNQS